VASLRGSSFSDPPILNCVKKSLDLHGEYHQTGLKYVK